MSNRRDFITLLGGAAVALPLAARAQQATIPVVAVVNGATAENAERNGTVFRNGISEIGYVDGQNVSPEYHSPKIIEKLSRNFAATRNFLLIGGSFGRSAYLALVPDRDAVGARSFLCHGIHNFTGSVGIKTDLPLTGQCLDELDSDFDPIRHRHIARCFYRKLDLFVCGDQSGRTSEPINPHTL